MKLKNNRENCNYSKLRSGRYVFIDWDKVQEKMMEKLIQFLGTEVWRDWIRSAKIEKIE